MDPAPIYADARANRPIFWSDATGGWVAARRDTVFRVLTDEDHFGPLSAGAGSSASHGRTILHMSGEEHRKKLAPISHRIRRTAALQGELGQSIADVTDELLASLPLGEAVDLKAAFTTPMPLIVTARRWITPRPPETRSRDEIPGPS